jgi:protein JSN1
MAPVTVNFERLDDAVRARKALNGRDVLGSDVGAIRIGFARVPTKNGSASDSAGDELTSPTGMPIGISPLSATVGGLGVQGVGELSVGATIHALRSVKGATAVPADQQVLGGSVENYRSNLLLSMVANGALGNSSASGGISPGGSATTSGGGPGRAPSVTEQQMIMRELSSGSMDAEAEVQALAGGFCGLFPGLRLVNSVCSRLSTSNDVLHHNSRSHGARAWPTMGRVQAA